MSFDKSMENGRREMVESFFDHKIAIVGAGNLCARFLEYFFREDHHGKKPTIIGVADKNKYAKGITVAEKLGFYTTTDYRDFARLDDLQVILEMSNDPTLSDVILEHMPPGVRVVDHYHARALWDLWLIQEFKDLGLRKIETGSGESQEFQNFLDELMERFALILEERTQRSRKIVKNLWEQEETVSQIIQGSTVPTFVIDRNHKIIHWNKAMERLTGVPSAEVVGTDRQWFPFYNSRRPSMADLVLDQMSSEEIGRFYDSCVNKSALIEGAYQAESFFQNLGENGKWLFITAAPIKTRSGRLIGAMETFWDRTEDKRLAQEQKRHTRELSVLVDIYTALNEPIAFEKQLDAAFQIIFDFMDANNACIFLMAEDGTCRLRYKSKKCDVACFHTVNSEMSRIVSQVVATGKPIISEKPPATNLDRFCPFHDNQIQSWIYIPVSDKENKPFGVIHITSRKPASLVHEENNILELICNRIGVAVENALLQEQYIKSEEKYRILFNNDPTPIFILDRDTCNIIDMNQRAEDAYGYGIAELYETPFLNLGDHDDAEIKNGLTNISPKNSVLFLKKRHYRKGGQPFYVTIVVSAAEYGGQNILIVNTTDITESVEKEAQLVQASKMTTLGVMAAGMAHEINQPLNVIQICADFFLKMIKKGEVIPTEDLKARTLNIVENVQRASQVIRRVRDFARQTEIVRNKININEPIKESLKVLSHELKSHRIDLISELDDSLPPIIADHNRLEQVFINLITNAIDALDEKADKHPNQPFEKRITINSSCEKGHVTVTVSDRGAGMSEYVREKIFEPFFTTKKTGKGTGLGVSISYGIVKDYDGKIEVVSKVGVGTTFKVSFPAAEACKKETGW